MKMLLPGAKWLERNGYSGLTQVLRARPELFAHIPKDTHYKTLSEWVGVAEQLAKTQGGTLPSIGSLQLNGYGGLASVIRNNRYAFQHLTLEVKRRLPQAWVSIADELARRHDGTLPNMQHLRNTGYGGLATAMHNHPELFRHITQDVKRRVPAEWVIVADKLVAQHGQLPNYQWLVDCGYRALCEALRVHPELFQHIIKTKQRVAA
jgi:hypothetical protein